MSVQVLVAGIQKRFDYQAELAPILWTSNLFNTIQVRKAGGAFGGDAAGGNSHRVQFPRYRPASLKRRDRRPRDTCSDPRVGKVSR